MVSFPVKIMQLDCSQKVKYKTYPVKNYSRTILHVDIAGPNSGLNTEKTKKKLKKIFWDQNPIGGKSWRGVLILLFRCDSIDRNTFDYALRLQEQKFLVRVVKKRSVPLCIPFNYRFWIDGDVVD
jgi:hypothetical protein